MRRRDLVVGYLPQEFSLDRNLTVAENVRAGAKYVVELIREFESLSPTSGKHAELEHRKAAVLLARQGKQAIDTEERALDIELTIDQDAANHTIDDTNS